MIWLDMGENIVGKEQKKLLTSISFFSTMFSKALSLEAISFDLVLYDIEYL